MKYLIVDRDLYTEKKEQKQLFDVKKKILEEINRFVKEAGTCIWIES